MQSLKLIIDTQFGSTGKGAIADYIAAEGNFDTVFTSWASNAGHTSVLPDGTTCVRKMLANSAISEKVRRVVLGPGSLIDASVLLKELEETKKSRKTDFRLVIHPHAAVITEQNRAEEADFHAIGSTKSGVGASMIQRIKRNPDNQNVAKVALLGTDLQNFVYTQEEFNNVVDSARNSLIEGAQGYGLSLYHGHYPYVTSRDVTTHQMLADAGIPFRAVWSPTVVGSMRTFPIRVANRYDASGKQIGYSGPCHPDQYEMDWKKDFNKEPELTTVTKLPRRIFSFSMMQAEDAVRMNGVSEIYLNFCNYIESDEALLALIESIDAMAGEHGAFIRYLGFGPRRNHIFDLSKHGEAPITEATLANFRRYVAESVNV